MNEDETFAQHKMRVARMKREAEASANGPQDPDGARNRVAFERYLARKGKTPSPRSGDPADSDLP
jgi:hypothetical protein